MTEPFHPTLLLSMPQLQDPNFARTVILLCDFVPEGAFGLDLGNVARASERNHPVADHMRGGASRHDHHPVG